MVDVFTVDETDDPSTDAGALRQVGNREPQLQATVPDPIPEAEVSGWNHFVPSGVLIPVYGTKKYPSSEDQ
jgi:hypothetical protein